MCVCVFFHIIVFLVFFLFQSEQNFLKSLIPLILSDKSPYVFWFGRDAIINKTFPLEKKNTWQWKIDSSSNLLILIEIVWRPLEKTYSTRARAMMHVLCFKNYTTGNRKNILMKICKSKLNPEIKRLNFINRNYLLVYLQ